ncbi:MAG: hypothetical protein IJ266_02855 [Elusimicrobiaceae bacterium]|nr:hypothetical protein [Elusimicrobiaceae bacterium]
MKNSHALSLALVICFCLALPAGAQRPLKSLPRAFTQAGATQPFTLKTLKITNLPTRPRVQILLSATPHVKNSVRLVPPRQVYPLIYKWRERKIFIPRNFVTQTKALYRGMSLTGIDELKNILVNGLDVNKSNYHKKIFTAYEPLTAVLYAQPTHQLNVQPHLPVLLKIPVTPALEQYAPQAFKTAQAFHNSVPASTISDVWILLEVNQKADWYKAVLEDGEIILFPSHAQLYDVP